VDDLEELLTAEFRDPELALDARRLLAGVRRRRRRNAATAAICVVAVLGLVSGTALAVKSHRPAPGGVAPAQPSVAMSSSPHAVMFKDKAEGYAVLTACPSDREVTDQGCLYEFASTEDGGRKWTMRRFPEPHAADELGPLSLDIEPLGGGHVLLLSRTAGREARWFSADQGDSWAKLPHLPQGSIREAPAGATVAFRCWTPKCELYGPVADFPDGRSFRIGSAGSHGLDPQDRAVKDRLPIMASDGSLWVAMFGKVNSVAVSRDRGRTWSKALTEPGEPAMHVFTNDGKTVYMFDREPGSVRVRRSGDGGKTWPNLKVPAVDESAEAALGQDGELLLHDGKNRTLYRYTADGASYAKAGGIPKLESIHQFGALVIGVGETVDPMQVYASENGRRWWRLPLG
jgi:hypothetical protein